MIIVVAAIYSLKSILLLRGLNHAPAIWLLKYINLLNSLSFCQGKTSAARSGPFCCCCNSWRLSFMLRLRTYASGAYFIEPHTFMLSWSHWGSPGASFWRPLRTPQALLAPRGPLLCAQAAEIRVRRLFHIIVHIEGGLYFMRRLRRSVPSAACGRQGGLYSMRRLRRFAFGVDFTR